MGFYYLDIQANAADRARAKTCGDIAEVYTPLVKCYASEASLALIAEADTLLLTVPNQLGVDYNAHVIEAILTHVAPALGWR